MFHQFPRPLTFLREAKNDAMFWLMASPLLTGRVRQRCIEEIDLRGLSHEVTSIWAHMRWTWRPWFLSVRHVVVVLARPEPNIMIVPVTEEDRVPQQVVQALQQALDVEIEASKQSTTEGTDQIPAE